MIMQVLPHRMGIMKQRFGQRNYRFAAVVKNILGGDIYTQQTLKKY